MPFPEPWTLQGASVRLTRTRCYGTCPNYEVTVAGEGTVAFNGHSFVLIPGHHGAHVPPQSVKELIAEFASDQRGGTALGTAVQYGCPACITLIEKAFKKREPTLKRD